MDETQTNSLSSWQNVFRDLAGSAITGYTQIKLAESNVDAVRAKQYDPMTGMYYTPGTRMVNVPGGSGLTPTAWVLIAGVAVVALVVGLRK